MAALEAKALLLACVSALSPAVDLCVHVAAAGALEAHGLCRLWALVAEPAAAAQALVSAATALAGEGALRAAGTADGSNVNSSPTQILTLIHALYMQRCARSHEYSGMLHATRNLVNALVGKAVF